MVNFIPIEDTDRKRSTAEAVDVIINGLNWLGLDYDGEIKVNLKERHGTSRLLSVVEKRKSI